MLSQTTKDIIASALKINKEDLEAALTSTEDVDLELPEIRVFTPSEVEARDKATKSRGYNEGKKAGEEMVAKGLKEKHGIEADGKNLDEIVGMIVDKSLDNANKKPTEQLQEKDQIITKLRATVEEQQGTIASINQEKEQVLLNTKLYASIPQGLPVDNDEFLYSMQSKGYSFVKGENGEVETRLNGETVVNPTTQTPLSYADVMRDYSTKRWGEHKPDKNGRGGESSKGKQQGGVITKASQLEKRFKEEGKSINGIEYATALEKAMKECEESGYSFEANQ